MQQEPDGSPMESRLGEMAADDFVEADECEEWVVMGRCWSLQEKWDQLMKMAPDDDSRNL